MTSSLIWQIESKCHLAPSGLRILQWSSWARYLSVCFNILLDSLMNEQADRWGAILKCFWRTKVFRVHFERAAYIRLVNWKAGSLFTGHELPEAYQFLQMKCWPWRMYWLRKVGQINCHNTSLMTQAGLLERVWTWWKAPIIICLFPMWDTFLFHREHFLCHIHFLFLTIYVPSKANTASGPDTFTQ